MSVPGSTPTLRGATNSRASVQEMAARVHVMSSAAVTAELAGAKAPQYRIESVDIA